MHYTTGKMIAHYLQTNLRHCHSTHSSTKNRLLAKRTS